MPGGGGSGLPKHRARANYWLGRTELALSDAGTSVRRFVLELRWNGDYYQRRG